MIHPALEEDAPVIAPPDTLTVYDEGPRIVLWLDERRALVRQIGFTAGWAKDETPDG